MNRNVHLADEDQSEKGESVPSGGLIGYLGPENRGKN
jgi:hypothetical protein